MIKIGRPREKFRRKNTLIFILFGAHKNLGQFELGLRMGTRSSHSTLVSKMLKTFGNKNFLPTFT
jgi:hypothetical protein